MPLEQFDTEIRAIMEKDIHLIYEKQQKLLNDQLASQVNVV
jgi:hypothetical protein